MTGPSDSPRSSTQRNHNMKAARRFDKTMRRSAREYAAKLAGQVSVPTTTGDAPTAAVQS